MANARARTTITLSAPPEYIDRFRVVRQIGMGAMGAVFSAGSEAAETLSEVWAWSLNNGELAAVPDADGETVTFVVSGNSETDAGWAALPDENSPVSKPSGAPSSSDGTFLVASRQSMIKLHFFVAQMVALSRTGSEKALETCQQARSS